MQDGAGTNDISNIPTVQGLTYMHGGGVVENQFRAAFKTHDHCLYPQNLQRLL